VSAGLPRVVARFAVVTFRDSFDHHVVHAAPFVHRRMLCDRAPYPECSNSTARVMQSWDPSMPLYGRLCGMLAFGCVRGSACGVGAVVGHWVSGLDCAAAHPSAAGSTRGEAAMASKRTRQRLVTIAHTLSALVAALAARKHRKPRYPSLTSCVRCTTSLRLQL
jgi:hypothetical protein